VNIPSLKFPYSHSVSFRHFLSVVMDVVAIRSSFEMAKAPHYVNIKRAEQ
jgi:hypothetical protein